MLRQMQIISSQDKAGVYIRRVMEVNPLMNAVVRLDVSRADRRAVIAVEFEDSHFVEPPKAYSPIRP